MKKQILLLLCGVFALTQINAQQTVEATKSGFVKDGSDAFTESVLKVKAKTNAWSRVSYIEVPVTHSEEVTEVKFKAYFYDSNTDGDIPVEFSTMPGVIPSGIKFDDQPADSEFTAIETVQVNKANYGWVTVDITAGYNEAVNNEASALTIRMNLADENSALIQLYSLAEADKEPHLSILNLQEVTVDAAKSGYVQNTSSTENEFYETVVRLKGKTDAWSRIGYLEVPITEPAAPNQVDLNVYFYKPIGSGDLPLEFATKAGALPADLSFVNQPDESSLTIVETQTINSATEGWVTVNITEEYNAALQAGESALTVRMISDQTAEMLEFYSLATGTDNKPHLSILSDCPPEYNDIEKTLVEGQSIEIDGQTITETGTYEEVSTTDCGAEKIDTYHVLFIEDGTVTNDVAICEGSSHEVQVGPNTYETYDAEGEYTVEVTSDDGTATKTIVTNITVNPLPVPQDLGDDTSIREGESLTLDAGSGFAAYQWYNKGVAIDGETNRTVDVTSTKDAFTFGTNEISVAVTGDKGCVGSSAKDIWVDIIGNFVAPSKDMFLEEAGDRLLDIGRLEVKNDTWGDQNNDVAGPPYYSKEVHLAFDLSAASLPSNATNFKLKLYLYALDDNPKQPTDNPSVNISCEYADGLYSDDMTWSTRTSASDRTPLAASVNVTESMINSVVEWDINDIFVDDILGKKNQFTVILSIPNDEYSILAKFRDVTNGNVDVRPAITFDLPTTAINDAKEKLEVSMSPNPVMADLNILNGESFKSAEVYNFLGQLMFSTPIENNRISMSHLPEGKYIIRLVSDNKKVSKVIIKK